MLSEIIILILWTINDGICVTPTLEYSSAFPVHANSTFQLILSAKESYRVFSIIRIEIIADSHLVTKTVIYPGIADQLEDKISNQYFWLENWFKDSSDRIHLLLRILEAANGMMLCVSFQEPNNREEKKAALQMSCDKQPLFLAKIKLTVDPQLHLSITTKDGRTDGVHHNDVAIISCVSRKGIPPYPPILSHSSSIQVKSNKVYSDSNTVILYFLASISDHGKTIICSAGQSSASITIHVFHNPTAVHLVPAYFNYLPNGTSVECVTSNGFPKPTVTWTFISGPPNPSKYYTISPSNNLTMSHDAPIGSNWVFNCSSINSIATSYDAGTTKTFRFTIYPVNKATVITLSVSISVGVLVVIAIVICCNKEKIYTSVSKIIHSRSGTNKDTGDDALNNFTTSIFTYDTVAQSTNDSGIDPESKKPTRKSRRQKAKRDSDIYEEDNIV